MDKDSADVRVEILPCPFCGGPANFEHDYREDNDRYPRDFWHVRVMCSGCEATLPDWVRYGKQEQRDVPGHIKLDAERKVLQIWNTRATPSPAPAVAEGSRLNAIIKWLESVSDIDLDAVVADGGITAGMVVQQEIRTVQLPNLQSLPLDETGWLIERRNDVGIKWLETLDGIGEDGWTTDSGSALRFARRKDADVFIEFYLGEPNLESGISLHVVEHMWAAPRAAIRANGGEGA